MRFTVKLFAYFRDNRFRAEVRDYPEGTTVEEVIRSLGIDLEEVGVTMINSRHCTLDQVPAENDQLAIFPAIGGG
ncbi:MAG: MoaD/ThiS family protein [Desulfobulbus sp.]|jgi:molybdopterin converting factor small subunit|nr:MoaD/ThiS family protein [Desulfobulbus sp.]